ncbi:MAG: hybrid sensor histidine kinase/response regulator [Roseateles sp.]|uniref:hybrid sensor histidine kinase/response regulator n=1 Tax=Roseateles sp. TaxID=1971397 RepID=UPI004034FC3B
MDVHTAPAEGSPLKAEDPSHLLRLGTDMLALGTWTLDLRDLRLTLSDQAASAFGQQVGGVISWEAALSSAEPGDQQSLRQALAACLSSRGPVDRNFRMKRPDGTPRWLRIRAEAVRDAKGEAVRVNGVCHDVTASKRAEQAVAETETRFQALVEGLQQVSVQGYDSQRRVIFWNGASERLYGYSREEALGRQLEDLIIPPQMRELVIEGTKQWLASGVVSVPAEELVLRHKDGSPVPVFSSHTMQRSLSGEALLYCVDVDLSDRVAAEAQRQELEARLREAQKMEALGTMAGGIAHDFNHVLGAVLANVNLAREMLPPAHPALVQLELIARCGRRARGMVQQILSFSRQQVLELQAVDLVAEARHALDLLQANRQPGVQQLLSHREPALWVKADAAQMQQLLMNLCTNALQALPPAGGRVEVELQRLHLIAPGQGLPDGDYARLTVRDNGSGMDAATRARVFEPFFTTKAPGQGSGLGLSVVHGIVLAHRGAIHVDSQPGRGTSFRIDLPCLEAEPHEAGSSDWAGLPADLSAPEQALIIYVDDDDVMRLTVRALLERAGYRVGLCGSAQEALALLAEVADEAALLVTDFNMPDGDGLALTRTVRRRHPALPVLISSGYVSETLARQAAAHGARAVLHKERMLEDLVARVRETLQPS